MNAKKWINIFVLLSFCGILFVSVANYIVDPFQQYRVKTFYPISYTKERYKNAGFSKNFNYDSIILGTSMTENFILEDSIKIGFNKPLKLSVSGGSAKEQSITLETAIDNNSNLKNVLWGLDNFIFIGDIDRLRYGPGSFPIYLYDNDISNDYKYLLSLDTLKESAKAVINPYRHMKNKPETYDYNKMYQWQHNAESSFTLNHVYESWNNRHNYINYEKDKQGFLYLKNSFSNNFKNIFEKNKHINFYIFLPPYSMLYFKHLEKENQLKDLFKFKKYIFSFLTKYNNIKVYDFSIAMEITHNLDNYKDMTHYHQKINTWMINQIKQNNYLVTKYNIDKNLKNLKKQIKDYDIEKVLSSKN